MPMAEISGAARGVAQRLVGDTLDGPAVHPGYYNGEHQRPEDQQWERLQTEEREQRRANGAEIRGNHIHFAVGEIDHPDNAVHHGVADGD